MNLQIRMFIQALRDNPYVREHFLGDKDNNISSFNFTRKAFQKGVWDKETIKARGLFIDTQQESIIARGYDKFFTLEEHKRLNLPYEIQYPLSCVVKENGYLGLFSTTNSNKPFFASKSSTVSWHAQEFQRILTEQCNNLDELTYLSQVHNCTFVFEVISHNDPHIIDYHGQDKVVLLDGIFNTIDGGFLSDSTLAYIAETLGLELHQPPVLIHNEQELINFKNKINHQECEGFVARTCNGFMFKYKTPYYRYWKSLRNLMLQLQHKPADNIRNYENRCIDKIHEKALPAFVRVYQDGPAPMSIITYRNLLKNNFGDQMHDFNFYINNERGQN